MPVITFGRLLMSAGELIMPWQFCSNVQNVDMRDEEKAAAKRNGYQRAVDVEMDGPVRMIVGFEDYDGDDFFLVIDDAGISREV